MAASLARLATGTGDPETSWSLYDKPFHSGDGPLEPSDLSDIASKGLGACGSASIPEHLMAHWAPDALLDQLSSESAFILEDPRTNKPCTDAFIDAMIRCGCMVASDLPPNCGGFVRSKNAEKVRFIANLSCFDRAQILGPPRFSLPRPDDLGALFDRPGATYFCALDVQNCYWSIGLPPAWQQVFRLTYRGASATYRTLPFGWDFAPYMCQAFLWDATARVRSHWPHATFLFYIDDWLIAADSPETARLATAELSEALIAVGLIISAKSTTTPVTRITWVGKTLCGLSNCIANTDNTCPHPDRPLADASSVPVHEVQPAALPRHPRVGKPPGTWHRRLPVRPVRLVVLGPRLLSALPPARPASPGPALAQCLWPRTFARSDDWRCRPQIYTNAAIDHRPSPAIYRYGIFHH